MIPVPQYPIYSALITLYGGKMVNYYLDETKNWALDSTELIKSLTKAKDRGTKVKAITVINPGNPTGQVLSYQNVKDIIEFAYDNQIAILADEVYQENIYVDKKFNSFKKVLNDLGEPYKSNVELISFHSISKGLNGECGLRGGYFEFVNIDKYAEEMILKLKSVNLCSNTLGMIGVGLMVNQPKIETNSQEIV